MIDLLSLIQEVALSQFDEKADLSDLSIEPQNLQLIYDLGISNLEYFKLSPKPESLLTMTFENDCFPSRKLKKISKH